MRRKHWQVAIVAVLAVLVIVLTFTQDSIADAFTQQRLLGQLAYFDTELSEPDGQSCASCHDPAFGFDDPDDTLPVSEGVIPGLFGSRNSPISAYAQYAPPFQWDAGEELYIGGQFWDGRATGAALGDPLADQAVGPFLNPVEMADPNKETVLGDVVDGPYASLFYAVCGVGELTDPVYVEGAYDCLGQAIGVFERSSSFALFTSRYDTYLRRCLALGGLPDDCAQGIGPAAALAGKMFTAQEWYGLQLFMGPNNNDGVLDPGEGAACSLCHVAEFVDPAVYAGYGLAVTVPARMNGLIPPLFTDFSYDNLGAPKSTHPLLVNNPVDYGLGAVLIDPLEDGKFKVMTVRDIGVTAPYLHHGFFATLEEVVHFYNTRDVAGAGWPPPEVPANVNIDELGNLGLGPAEEAAIAAFMRTLTDGNLD